MSNKVYVGNLPYSFLNDDLRRLFAAFGPVKMAEVILDRTTNRSRGFGFVEMESADGVREAISNLHETELQGRRLTVTEAREREPGGPAGGGGAPRSYSGPRTSGGNGYGSPRPGGGPEYGSPRSSRGQEFGAPRSSGGPYGGARPSGGVGGGPSSGFGGGRGGGSPRGDRRPRRDEGDRWSDGGGGGRRRRRDDDFGDE